MPRKSQSEYYSAWKKMTLVNYEELRILCEAVLRDQSANSENYKTGKNTRMQELE